MAEITDNVRAELQFVDEHPGTQIIRRPADIAAGRTIRYTGTLPDADGGGKAESTELGDLISRLRRLAAEHQIAVASYANDRA
jgi:hypothetical protein